MGKRIVAAAAEHHRVTPPIRTIRKRKTTTGAAAKSQRLSAAASTALHNCSWHENDDEDSSSNDALPARNQSSKQANNSSILLNSCSNNELGAGADTAIIESPKPVYTLRPSVVNGTILYDLTQKPWRLGRPIGKGNFGEIFLASDNIAIPVTNENAKFVVKIEPHSNGPLFVEIHCLMNTAKEDANIDHDKKPKSTYTSSLPHIPPSGIPDYIASGSHFFGNARYRFLVLQRFDRDLHSLIKNCRVHQNSVLTLAIQIVNVLENLHDKGYCHNDVKAQNLMISKCKYYKQKVNTTGNGKSAPSVGNNHKKRYDEHYEEKQPTTDSGNSSEQEANEDDNRDDDDFVLRRKRYADEDDDEDFDDGATMNSNKSDSTDAYQTPVNTNRNRRARKAIVEFSGSNPVRSCRRQKRNSIYEEMVSSHYLRPTKRISYSEFFNEDGSAHGDEREANSSSTDESEDFVPKSARRFTKKPASSSVSTAKRPTRHQEKVLTLTSNHYQQQQHHYRNAVVPEFVSIEEERIFLIDFGLASKFVDNGVHRPFVMDQRRAHDGTLEFTSRDAHMGAHSRRSDLECLGYNLIFWSQGYLPWKDAAVQHQQEKVHRAKEYLMTDVREMLKQIYGKQVPKYLGEFLHHVGQLAYHERPNYARLRRIFEREFEQLECLPNEMHLDSSEIVRTCVRVKEEVENKNDIFELGKPQQNMWSIMNNISVATPFQERTLSNRVSPKNLRSKSGKKSIKKKKFSWAEVLSQDPDQIARERAEKEFDREEELSEVQHPTVRRYEGKPTYAILEIQHRLKLSGRFIEDHNTAEEVDEVGNDPEEEDMEMDEVEVIDQSEEETDEEPCKDQAEDEKEEGDSETDTTEVSDVVQNKNRYTRRTRNASTAVTTTYRANSKSASRTTNARTRGTSSIGKRSSITEFTTRTRSTATIMTSTTTTSTIQNNRKCGSATRGRKTAKDFAHAASAAGELDQHNALRCSETGQRLANGPRNGNSAGFERRTRRCLIKTDAEMKAAEDEESNSNFSPDVRSLFNVWKKINNETMYFRGSKAAARHCKK